VSQRAYVKGDRICCAACSTPVGRVRTGVSGSKWADLDAGWMHSHGVWKITPRARERLREGRRPSYRRLSPDAPGADPRHYITLPARIECWSCSLTQWIEQWIEDEHVPRRT
jgi:hypothetical protein